MIAQEVVTLVLVAFALALLSITWWFLGATWGWRQALGAALYLLGVTMLITALVFTLTGCRSIKNGWAWLNVVLATTMGTLTTKVAPVATTMNTN